MHSSGGTSCYVSPVLKQRYCRVSTGIEDEQFEKTKEDVGHLLQIDEENMAVPHTGFIQYTRATSLEDHETPWRRIHYEYKNPTSSTFASDQLLFHDQKQHCLQLQARKATMSWSCIHENLRDEVAAMSRVAGNVNAAIPETIATARSSWLHEDLAEIMSPNWTSQTNSEQLPHEHLFYKIVTPSDVGKLNRLVIPKQHAERYLPIHPSHRKRGLLLSFRDVDLNVAAAAGKIWWFRYSYWSSSQSYVLTKGWIRFVKEKRLQAGDIISFERGMRDEFYISCRRKPTPLFERQPAQRPKIVTCSNFTNHSINSSSSTTLQQPSEGRHHDADRSHHQLRMPLITTDPLNNSTSKLKLFGVDLRIQPPD